MGLVVSEMRFPSGEEKRLDTHALQYLKEEALAFDMQEDEACLAAEEEEKFLAAELESDLEGGDAQRDGDETVVSERNSTKYCLLSSQISPLIATRSQKRRSNGNSTAAAKFFCYMCYENHDTSDDPLVAPCDCKGDTRYLHVQCLQKW